MGVVSILPSHMGCTVHAKKSALGSFPFIVIMMACANCQERVIVIR